MACPSYNSASLNQPDWPTESQLKTNKPVWLSSDIWDPYLGSFSFDLSFHLVSFSAMMAASS